MLSTILRSVLLLLLIASFLVLSSPFTLTPKKPERGQSDFNGDGYADLAVGVPYDSVGGVARAGSVIVFYGSPTGLPQYGQTWNQDSPGVYGACEADDLFGTALAIGDYNNDGYADLAIGVPGEDVSFGGRNRRDAGIVNVLFGSPNGLGTWSTDQGIYQGGPVFGIAGEAEEGDAFGSSLLAADFNGDGFDDLAMGAPGEDVGDIVDAGTVNVLYGSPGPPVPAGVAWDQTTRDVGGTAENADRFGSALLAGDYDGDGFMDLAILVPGEDVNITGTEAQGHGAVNLLFGSSDGLEARPSTDLAWYGALARGGYSILRPSYASGDFNGDGREDLCVGLPTEAVGDNPYGGVANLLFGSAAGLAAPLGYELLTVPLPAPGAFTVTPQATTSASPSALGSYTMTGDASQDDREGVISELLRRSAQAQNRVNDDEEAWGRISGKLKGAANRAGQIAPPDAAGADSCDQDLEEIIEELHRKLRDALGESDPNALTRGRTVARALYIRDLRRRIANYVEALIRCRKEELLANLLGAAESYVDGYLDEVYGYIEEYSLTGIPTYTALGSLAIYNSFIFPEAAKPFPAAAQLSQDFEGMEDACEAGDRFGSAVATGDFNRDGFADLALGVPGEDLHLRTGDVTDGGAVSMFFGSKDGLTALDDDWLIYESRRTVGGTPSDGDEVGRALISGDFDGDGFSDLAVGAPGKAYGPHDNAGATFVLYGSPAGLFSDYASWHQNREGVASTCENGDRFGQVLTVGDFDGDGHDDLAIAAPSEDVTLAGGTTLDAGCITILYGSDDGLEARAPEVALIQGTGADEGSRFGAIMAVSHPWGKALEAPILQPGTLP